MNRLSIEGKVKVTVVITARTQTRDHDYAIEDLENEAARVIDELLDNENINHGEIESSITQGGYEVTEIIDPRSEPEYYGDR